MYIVHKGTQNFLREKLMGQKNFKSFYDPSIGSMVHVVLDERHTSSEEPAAADTAYIPSIPKHLVVRLNGETDKALAVFTVLWRESTMQRTLTVSCSTTEHQSWGISHDQKTRALATLEGMGLIHVQAQRGKNPLVTLCVAVTPWEYQTTKYYPPPHEAEPWMR
jgi:hypothetical protein